jgi:hypothetical protein
MVQLVLSKTWLFSCYQCKLIYILFYIFQAAVKCCFLDRLISLLLMPHERHVYLVATSGDTGAAVIDGFSRLSDQDK